MVFNNNVNDIAIQLSQFFMLKTLHETFVTQNVSKFKRIDRPLHINKVLNKYVCRSYG